MLHCDQLAVSYDIFLIQELWFCSQQDDRSACSRHCYWEETKTHNSIRCSFETHNRMASIPGSGSGVGLKFLVAYKFPGQDIVVLISTDSDSLSVLNVTLHPKWTWEACALVGTTKMSYLYVNEKKRRKHWEPEKANGDYNRRKAFKDVVGIQNFRNWNQGRDANFSNSNRKNIYVWERKMIRNSLWISASQVHKLWWRVCNVSSLQSDFGSTKGIHSWAKICYRCQVIALRVARCILNNPNLKAVYSFCVFGFVLATVTIVKSDLSESTSRPRQCLFQGNIIYSERERDYVEYFLQDVHSLWMANHISLLPRLQSLDWT